MSESPMLTQASVEAAYEAQSVLTAEQYNHACGIPEACTAFLAAQDRYALAAIVAQRLLDEDRASRGYPVGGSVDSCENPDRYYRSARAVVDVLLALTATAPPRHIPMADITLPAAPDGFRYYCEDGRWRVLKPGTDESRDLESLLAIKLPLHQADRHVEENWRQYVRFDQPPTPRTP